MNVFEEILENIDISKEVYKILGLPDPEKYPEVDQPLASPTITTWDWCKRNRAFLGVIGLVVLIVILLSTRRTKTEKTPKLTFR